MANAYSDLEAVRDSDQPGLEHNPMIQHQVFPAKYSDAPSSTTTVTMNNLLYSLDEEYAVSLPKPFG